MHAVVAELSQRDAEMENVAEILYNPSRESNVSGVERSMKCMCFDRQTRQYPVQSFTLIQAHQCLLLVSDVASRWNKDQGPVERCTARTID